jgi:ubiquitin-activating enzyme E1
MTDLTQNSAFMDLYSRQIGAYGIETMGKLIQMKVLIVGLKGIGIEAAKNLTLAGPGAVILHDDEPTEVCYILCPFVMI